MNRLSRSLLTSLLLGCIGSSALGQPAYVGAKQEFRGVWIATVKNYDWPLSRSHSPQQQKDSLLALLDDFAGANFNAVIFQIRPECDALFTSPYEPWSYWLTGSQGIAPNPLYDPLAFAVTEAHKRGMELHAWFNPYRAYREDNTYQRHSSHVTSQHPDWIITCPDGYKLLDPGLPAVRSYVAMIVADVIRRYDIDGVHFDDYFYPYSEHSFTKQDSATWAKFPRGFSWDSVAYWRRDNVNLLVHQVYDSVQAIKSWVKFGVSPFGIWKSNVPPGVSGTSAYDVIYCDATAWLKGQYVDYIIPQLYWAFGGGQDYGLLQPWWATQRNGRHYFTGNADYKIKTGWSAAEITNQIRFNQTTKNSQGSVQYQASNIHFNDGGIRDLLTADVFRFPAHVPVMAWKDVVPPNAPTGLHMTFNVSRSAYELSWQAPPPASDGERASRYLLYRFRTSAFRPNDQMIPSNLIMVTGATTAIPPARIDSEKTQYWYAVSALDKNNNESDLTSAVTVAAPLSAPTLMVPADGEQRYTKGAPLRWRQSPGATLYRVQVDTAGTFVTERLLLNKQTADSTILPGVLQAQKTYYWRVIGGNQTAESPASVAWSFTSGWLLPPILKEPVNVVNVDRKPTLRWYSNGATSYRVRVIDFATRVAILDTSVTDTSWVTSIVLEASKIFTWYVLANNGYGESDWSAEGRFRTGTEVTGTGEANALPLRFGLEQNFPNPFNPTTTISYAVAGTRGQGLGVSKTNAEVRYHLPAGQAGISEFRTVRLSVYDILGREIAVLVNEKKEPGTYQVTFDATGLPSGVYLYRLTAGGFTDTKKLLLLR